MLTSVWFRTWKWLLFVSVNVFGAGVDWRRRCEGVVVRGDVCKSVKSDVLTPIGCCASGWQRCRKSFGYLRALSVL